MHMMFETVEIREVSFVDFCSALIWWRSSNVRCWCWSRRHWFPSSTGEEWLVLQLNWRKAWVCPQVSLVSLQFVWWSSVSYSFLASLAFVSVKWVWAASWCCSENISPLSAELLERKVEQCLETDSGWGFDPVAGSLVLYLSCSDLN